MKKKINKEKANPYHKEYGVISNSIHALKSMLSYSHRFIPIIIIGVVCAPIMQYLWSFISKFVIDMINDNRQVSALILLMTGFAVIQILSTINGSVEVHKACDYAYEYLKFDAIPDAMVKGSKKTSNGEHIIEFLNVSFRYPRSENYVLRNLNLTIRQGEHLSVVGINGAGKTTFIKLLCRMYDVTEGEIRIDGINIKEYSDDEYRKLFAVVFQDFSLFAFSLKDNIILNEKADDKKLENTLKMAGLYVDAMKLENKVETTIFKSYDEKGTELSGGQQQKTAICRALYRDSPIVILDEPTAALDPIAEYEIYKRFNDLVGGKTAIYISHRLSSCKFCDRIAVFADDTIKEYGTHDELVNIKDGIYAGMYAAQAEYYIDNAS